MLESEFVIPHYFVSSGVSRNEQAECNGNYAVFTESTTKKQQKWNCFVDTRLNNICRRKICWKKFFFLFE